MFDPGDHDFGEDDFGPIDGNTGLTLGIIYTLVAVLLVSALFAAIVWTASLLAMVMGL